MIRLAKGNLLKDDAEALVNTVNTVGVMGKGIALMFKDAFPDNAKAYVTACKAGLVEVGTMFVTERSSLIGPKWIINFPTKKHWRNPSKLEWVEEGLADLRKIVEEKQIRSIAIPPLGSGNGGLEWSVVRERILSVLGDLPSTEVTLYEPTAKYQNVTKRAGIEKLTPARALIAELIRRYWVLGIECSLLEVQKLAFFLERDIRSIGVDNPLDLRFVANRYGPYAHRLTHLLNSIDGSYLHCEKRIADASPTEAIWFNETKREKVAAYLSSAEAKPYLPALDRTSNLIDGFQSPLGLELLATIGWLLDEEHCAPTVDSIRDALIRWPGGQGAGERKNRLFNDRLIDLALEKLADAA